MIYKTSVVCLLMLTYMLFFYGRNPHIPHRLTRLFRLILVEAFAHAVLDMVTLYTVNHRDVVPESVNVFFHICYLLTILFFIFSIYLYLLGYLENNVRTSRLIRMLQATPLSISLLGILFAPISYVQGKVTAYSFGPKVFALYFSLVIYNIAILVCCIRYWKYLGKERRTAIIMSFPLFFVTSVVQVIFPETLLTLPCITLVTLGLMLSNENVEKYLDKQSGLFNQYAFSAMLKEYQAYHNRFYVGVLCFCQKESSMNWAINEQVLHKIHHLLKMDHQVGYRISENGVVMLFSMQDNARLTMEAIRRKIGSSMGEEDLDVEFKVIPAQNEEEKQDCMKQILDFCDEVSSKFAYVDYLTHIYNRNALNRDLEKTGKDKEKYYFIADMNNFKVVNDTMGHSVGDAMLQSFAVVLQNAVGKSGKVYRRGGDEFCIIYEKDVTEFLEKLSTCCTQVNRMENVALSYAIGYCRMDDPDYCNVADHMMYENKRAMKQGR